MKIKYIIFASLLFLLSCTKSFDKKLLEDLNARSFSPNVSQSVIDLKSITSFEWDVMHIFGGSMRSAEIFDVIGLKCRPVPDGQMRIVFLKEGKIVHESQYYAGEGIQFTDPNSSLRDDYDGLCFKQEEAVFYVLKRKKRNGSCFYDLYPVDVEQIPVYPDDGRCTD